MKKSPWKFLVGLATRRRESDSEDAASASKSDTDVSSALTARHGSTPPSAVHQDDLPAPTLTSANSPDPVVEDAAGAALAPPTVEVKHASAFAGQNEPSQSAGVDAKDAAVEAGAASPQVRRTRGPGRPKNVGGGSSSRWRALRRKFSSCGCIWRTSCACRTNSLRKCWNGSTVQADRTSDMSGNL